MRRKIVGIILIVIGLSIACTALYLKFSAASKESNLISQYEKNIKNLNNGENTANSSDSENPSGVLQDENGTIGIMIIPKINVKVPINEGAELDTLKYAVGHFKGTAMPGSKGNFCVAGHRNSAYNKYFDDLDKLSKGDEVIVRTTKGEYTYIITGSQVVEPNDTSVLKATDDATITLVTCTPKGVFNKRLIVKGKLK